MTEKAAGGRAATQHTMETFTFAPSSGEAELLIQFTQSTTPPHSAGKVTELRQSP